MKVKLRSVAESFPLMCLKYNKQKPISEAFITETMKPGLTFG